MLKSLVCGGMMIAASFCAVLFTACGITPLYYPPIDDKSPETMFDAEACSSLLKGGTLKTDDGDVTIAFSECKDDVILTDTSSLKVGFE